jgi:hypothetical protein
MEVRIKGFDTINHKVANEQSVYTAHLGERETGKLQGEGEVS